MSRAGSTRSSDYGSASIGWDAMEGAAFGQHSLPTPPMAVNPYQYMDAPAQPVRSDGEYTELGVQMRGIYATPLAAPPMGQAAAPYDTAPGRNPAPLPRSERLPSNASSDPVLDAPPDYTPTPLGHPLLGHHLVGSRLPAAPPQYRPPLVPPQCVWYFGPCGREVAGKRLAALSGVQSGDYFFHQSETDEKVFYLSAFDLDRVVQYKLIASDTGILRMQTLSFESLAEANAYVTTKGIPGRQGRQGLLVLLRGVAMPAEGAH